MNIDHKIMIIFKLIIMIQIHIINHGIIMNMKSITIYKKLNKFNNNRDNYN